MPTDSYPLRVLLLTVSGFVNRHQADSLRRACHEFVEHYHTERAHQGLGNERVVRGTPMGTGEVQCMERLGGILKHHRRAA